MELRRDEQLLFHQSKEYVEPTFTTLYILIGRCFVIGTCICYDSHSGSVRDWRPGGLSEFDSRSAQWVCSSPSGYGLAVSSTRPHQAVWVPPLLPSRYHHLFPRGNSPRTCSWPLAWINNTWRYISTPPYVFTQHMDSYKLKNDRACPRAHRPYCSSTRRTVQCDVFTRTVPQPTLYDGLPNRTAALSPPGRLSIRSRARDTSLW